jgi:hypothetical protein
MLRLFYILLTTELFLGGGGRLIEIGTGTLRMLLFTIALGIMLLPQFWRRLGDDVMLAFGMVCIFFVVHLPPLIFGLVNGVDVGTVFGEVQPLMYFLIAPFFSQVLHNHKYINITSDLVRKTGLVLSIAYIGTVISLILGLLDFQTTYSFLSSSGEFMFKGTDGLFVYKGFLYLGIALIFYVAIDCPNRYLAITLLSSAIVLTLTRGFMLSSAISLILLFWLKGNRKAVATCVLFSIVITVIVFGPGGSDESILTRKDADISDAVRYEDIAFMLSNVDGLSLLFGHGFGSLISSSRLTIENSFLWIWWKSGLVGLMFWISPLIVCYEAFKRIPVYSAKFTLGCAFFCSVVLIYIQSMANPYITNPIGLSFVMIATFSLRRLARDYATNTYTYT